MGPRPTAFAPADLLEILKEARPEGRLLVAYSGGLDSTALLLALHALSEDLEAPLEAVHVNHGAHPDASSWAAHCAATCEALGVPLHLLGPPSSLPEGGSPEERLRQYRYAAFECLLTPTDVLCTAQHRQDQAETLLLALLRGSGPHGLAAMPRERPLGAGRLLRPLLDVDRPALEAWLRERGAGWVEDPTNAEVDADRNYLRREILPRLRSRWPATDAALATSARLQGEARSVLEQEGALALAGRRPFAGVLDLRGLDPLGPAFSMLLRLWLQDEGAPALPRRQLAELGRQLNAAGSDTQVGVQWKASQLRHYRGQLWLDGPQSPASLAPLASRKWRLEEVLTLPGNGGELRCRALPQTRERGDADHTRTPAALDSLPVRSRAAGDCFRMAPGRPARKLKHWLSTSPLPPWFRDAVPVVPGPEGLRVIGDVVLDQGLHEALKAHGVRLEWLPADPSLAGAWKRCRASLLQVE